MAVTIEPLPACGFLFFFHAARCIASFFGQNAKNLTKRNLIIPENDNINLMNKSQTLLLATVPVLLSLSLAHAQQSAVADAPEGAGATTIYRQVMPDGRVVYSDTVTKGVEIDRILSVPPAENRTASKPAIAERPRATGNTGTATGSQDTGR